MVFIENGEGSLSVFGLILLMGFLVFFVGLLVLAIQYDRKQKQKIQQVAQSLVFTSITPNEELTQKISWLYLRAGSLTHYVLRHVSRQVIPDGEMLLFDLVDTSGEDESITERQAVAIVSPYLKLPQFSFFPKADKKYMLSGFANQIVEWGLARMGTPISFPDHPDFAERYVVSSLQPEEARRFFDDDLLHFFSKTQLYTLHAGGDVFTFSEMNTQFKTGELEDMTLRVNRALEILRQFHKSYDGRRDAP